MFDFFKKRKSQTGRFDIDKFVAIANKSAVPSVTVIVVVWALCSMMLTLSLKRQRDFSDWQIGQRAPQTFHARRDFKYTDIDATEKLRQEAKERTPDYFRIREELSRRIKDNTDEFFQRAAARNQRNKDLIPETTPVAGIVNRATPALLDALADFRNSEKMLEFFRKMEKMLDSGIIRQSDKASRKAGKLLKVFDTAGRSNLYPKNVSEYPDPEQAGAELAMCLDKEILQKEFGSLLTALIGEKGNLVFDPASTAAGAETAMAKVVPVVRNHRQNTRIISMGETITPTKRSMLDAENKSLPRDYKINHWIFNLAVSFVMLLVTVFYLVALRPKLLQDSRNVLITGTMVAVGLLVNYSAIWLFDLLVRNNIVTNHELLSIAIPVELPMVLLVVMLGFRCAMAVGFLIVSVTVLMVMPDSYNQFHLLFRWMIVGGICSLCVAKVVSYRTFFLRVFFCSLMINLLINFDQMIHAYPFQWQEINEGFQVMGISSFVSAVLALVLIFVFEIIFNLDTNMALTVLGNFNHPLLEQLRRRAPGTMSHSITVATLAEDAAKAINANPLRAKAGALFHDIGKMERPEYYTENNPDSALLHERISPELSSIVIRDHVKNGLKLARKYHLFRYIRDAIATHHGNDIVKFFYEQAKKERAEAGEPETSVLEADFRYTGTPPVEKELVILCLADACEAASRSLHDPSESRIRKLVEDIFISRLRGGLLNNSKLSLQELDAVRNSFVETLLGIHHGRISYDEKEKNETPDLFMAEPDSAQTRKK